MKGGGHSQANMEELKKRGIAYKVEKTYDNGVRIGGVENHRENVKRIDKTGQAWFPEDWDEDRILTAGTAVANDGQPLINGYHKTGVYDGIAVRILMDNGKVSTICPDLDQSLYVLGVVEND